MDGGLVGAVQRFLDQDQDLAFGITTAVGDFTVISFEAEEEVNGLYEVRIELASPDAQIDLHDLMDTQACLSAHSKYSEPRYWNGIVVGAERGDSGSHRTLYSLTLRPSLYRLAHISDCKIYQQLPVQEIVKQVFAEFGVHSVSWRLEGKHEPRDFCCQFNESALRFVTRLLGEEGAFWHFNHTPDSHELIITDAPLATPILPHAESITYNTRTGGQSKGFWISSFVQREKLCSTAYELNDYSFRNPEANYKQPWRLQENNGLAGEYPLYEYPGRYKDPNKVGKHFVKHRMESTRVDATTGKGKTNNIHLMPGYHFSITDHDDGRANGSHFLLSVKHKGQQPTALQEDAPDQGATTYEAEFITMPGRLPYRQPIVPKPVVDGPQIAIVTGPEGEEIYTDQFGRVKIWLPWDRHGEKNEHSSCWVRVSQNWAGGSWGHMAIPRIGHEVIVDFLDGDVDQPIISGRAHHSVNVTPYKLPEHKTRMTIKSQTHKGKGFNELRFEDEAGREEIFVHAQKDRNEKIRNNHTERIDNNWVQSIGSDKSIVVEDDHDEIVGGNMTLFIGSSSVAASLQSKLSRFTQGIGGLATKLRVGKLPSLGRGNLIISTESNRVDATGLTSSETIGVAKNIFAGGRIQMEAGSQIDLHSGRITELDSNGTTSVSAAERLTINCGEARITMEPDGTIHLHGNVVNMTANDKMYLSAGNTMIIKGKKVEIN